ncbi:MAG: division/cell wall cluster transcriptional repressor MraZ [Planctomycetes bacterium]|nr:division/cell wall cluster transcriptional repressor MraZ [Planctomycetota bacterium]
MPQTTEHPATEPNPPEFVLGEFRRTLDDRYRLSIPGALIEALEADAAECILAKERPGCLSLWNAPRWQAKLDEGIGLVERKMRSGRLEGRLTQVQLLGRLLSTRHKNVQLAGKGRLLVPEGFREFLRVEPGAEVILVGAAICLEIWHPRAWLRHLGREMVGFRTLFDELSG